MTSPVYERIDCPVCGASDGEEVADADAIRHEVELLWEFHDRRLRPGTPPERLVDRVAFSQDPARRIERCRSCGLVWRNPRESAAALLGTYAGEAVDAEAMDALFETQRPAMRAQVERLQAATERPGRLLEVGSYVGAFLAEAASAGWEAEGVDVNEAAVRFARDRGLVAVTGDLPSRAARDRGAFDAVAIWNCFDQLPEPRTAARAAAALLRTGGMVVVRVPNGAFWAALRPRLRGPGAGIVRALLAHNNLLAFPYRHGFTPQSLHRVLGDAGLRVTAIHGDALVPIADEWTRPWAAWEERAVKRALTLVARADASAAPWIEAYAVRDA